MLKKILNKLSSNKKTALIFTLSSLLMTGSNLLSGIIIIRWLSPQDLGYWNSIYVTLYYVSFLQFGIFNGLNRELPFYMGKGEYDKVEILASSAMWVAKVLVLFFFIITFFAFIFMTITKEYSEKEIFSITILGFIIASQFYNNYLTVTFRANKSFLQLSRAYFIQTLLILLSVFLVYFYKYYGYVIRNLILSISLVFMIHYLRPLKTNTKFNKEAMILLLKTGIPLFTLVYFLTITDTFNRIILLKIGDTKTVGMYYPALAVIVGMKMLPSAFSQYLYPRMSYEVGKSNDYKKLWAWVWKSAFSIIGIMLPIAILLYFLLPYAFDMFFPLYKESLFAARLAVFSGVLSGAFIVITVFNSLKKWKLLSIIAILKVSLYWGLEYFFAKHMVPINGIAVGTIISDFIFLIIVLVFSYYLLNKTN